jgi:hypothetical protein
VQDGPHARSEQADYDKADRTVTSPPPPPHETTRSCDMCAHRACRAGDPKDGGVALFHNTELNEEFCTAHCSGGGYCGQGRLYTSRSVNGEPSVDCTHCGPSPAPYVEPAVEAVPR